MPGLMAAFKDADAAKEIRLAAAVALVEIGQNVNDVALDLIAAFKDTDLETGRQDAAITQRHL
jgi:hypothetical protein